MGKGLFVTATGTDIGKTYITALILKKLNGAGVSAGYYKAALSGADNIADSDAGYVKRISGIDEPLEDMISYLYKNAVSPHLAAQIEGNPVELDKVAADYKKVSEAYDYITVEGSGGIVCPIRYDDNSKIFLTDIIRLLDLKTVIVADAGLGTINAVVLTAEYLRGQGITAAGVILNKYCGVALQDDNIKMIEEIAKLPVIACVRPDDTDISIPVDKLLSLYE